MVETMACANAINHWRRVKQLKKVTDSILQGLCCEVIQYINNLFSEWDFLSQYRLFVLTNQPLRCEYTTVTCLCSAGRCPTNSSVARWRTRPRATASEIPHLWVKRTARTLFLHSMFNILMRFKLWLKLTDLHSLMSLVLLICRRYVRENTEYQIVLIVSL